jgi:hypothetical protein
MVAAPPTSNPLLVTGNSSRRNPAFTWVKPRARGVQDALAAPFATSVPFVGTYPAKVPFVARGAGSRGGL